MFEKTIKFIDANRKGIQATLVAGSAVLVLGAVAFYSNRAGFNAGVIDATSAVNENLKSGTLVWGDGHNVSDSSEAAQLAAETLRKLTSEHPNMWGEVFPTPFRKAIG